ncbi:MULTISPECIES: hypothetical protein [Pseudomonas]|uniref:hypothetical protein n=1 Tax=Pseudomonas TaxID=286 RepID=UPI001E445CEC|nr:MULTISPECIES: hypothetical protein [Pseudomonas]MEC4021823.1 hypothetical protein [Pseudomonas fulva]
MSINSIYPQIGKIIASILMATWAKRKLGAVPVHQVGQHALLDHHPLGWPLEPEVEMT